MKDDNNDCWPDMEDIYGSEYYPSDEEGNEILAEKDRKLMEKIKEEEKKKKEEKKQVPIVSDGDVKEESIKEEKKEYYTAKGGKKEKKDNFDNKGDKDLNNPYDYKRIIVNEEGHSFKCFFGEEILYWYDKTIGKHVINGESRVKKMVQNHSNTEFRGARKNHVSETVELIKREFLTEKPNEEALKYILLVGNGIITTKDKDGKIKFVPGFNSNYFIMSGIPWNYNSGTKCPKIRRFLIELVVDIEKCDLYPDTNELWNNLTGEEKNKVLTLVEFIGYCLLRSCDLKKFLILKGGKDSGKSKYTDLVEKFLGYESCSGISLQEMRHEYNVAEIYGKMANIRGELSDKNLEDTSIIKLFVNGDPITGRVIRARPIRFRPFAKLIYATNIIPATSSTEDESFFGKIVIIDCPNTFKRDDTFFNRISTKDEMEGLLNWALNMLGTLMENMRFSYEPDWEEVARRFPRYTKGARYDVD